MRARPLALLLLVALAALRCAPAGEDDVCARAEALLHGCGVSLPYLGEGACIGTRVTLADCVLEHAADCRDVADLHEHYEACLDEYLSAADEVPETVPYVDLGGDDEREPEDTNASCSDGVDNDGDGAVDCGDPSCLESEVVTVCD